MINLLPWRTQQQRRQQQQFLWGWLSIELCCLLIIWLLGQWLIEKNQQLIYKNQHLQQQIKQQTQANQKLSSLQPLRLQSNQSANAVIQILKTLPQLLPISVTLTQIKYQQNNLQLMGYAMTYANLAEFFRQLTALSMVKNYHLLNTAYQAEKQALAFTLVVVLQ